MAAMKYNCSGLRGDEFWGLPDKISQIFPMFGMQPLATQSLPTSHFHFHFKVFKHKIPSVVENDKRKKPKDNNTLSYIHITAYLSKTYLEAAALPGSGVFVFFRLLK